MAFNDFEGNNDNDWMIAAFGGSEELKKVEKKLQGLETSEDGAEGRYVRPESENIKREQGVVKDSLGGIIGSGWKMGLENNDQEISGDLLC